MWVDETLSRFQPRLLFYVILSEGEESLEASHEGGRDVSHSLNLTGEWNATAKNALSTRAPGCQVPRPFAQFLAARGNFPCH
jgi:hypothetical protein